MPKQTRLMAAAIVAGLFILGAGPAFAAALKCDAVTGTAPTGECQITTLHKLGAGGTFAVDRTLHIFGPSGELRTNPGSTLTLNITGALIIDVGGKITGKAGAGNSSGATITITAGGAVLLAGNGTDGALISVDQLGGSCSGGKGGAITITSTSQSASASITTQNGSRITSDARCSAGEIAIKATQGGIDIQGLVESASTLTGTGPKQAPGGGPITISASCNLTINDTGRVSSRGNDPGADLVHLEAGGDVLIIGAVESTGPGHAVPNKPQNHCAGQKRPDKPAGSTACVEVWAGKSLVIDGSATNHGEINADTGQVGGHRIAWIDLFARGDITINGGGAAPYAAGARPYAVHANEFTSDSSGGLITVKSKSGQVTLTGQAVQADGGLGTNTFQPTLGGIGGVVTIEAGGGGTPGGDISLGAASVRARGANSGGGGQAGGDIAIRSFNGHVVGAAPGELNAGGGGGKATPDPGTVTLRGCHVPPPAVSYTGTATPAATTAVPGCGGGPAFQSYVVFLDSSCDILPLPKTFCEKGSVEAVLDPASGRFPGNHGPDVVVDLRTQSLQAAIDGGTDTNGDGYIIIGVIAQDNGVPGGHGSQQIDVTEVYDKPFALIGCGVTLVDPSTCDGLPPVQIEVSARSPEFPVGSGVTLYFQEITVTDSDSAPGWVVKGDGRFLEAVGSQRNLLGIRVGGNHNTIHNGFASTNLSTGISVRGNANTIDTVQAADNDGGDGIWVMGNQNSILNSTAGSQGSGNGGDGIVVRGAGNLISGNGAFSNGADGINVSGGTAASPNVVKGNVAGGQARGNAGNGIVLGGTGTGVSSPVELEANTAQGNSLDGFRVTGSGHQLKNNVSGGVSAEANGACQYEVASGNINATGNKSGSLLVPGANGSPFPTGCL